MTVKIKSSCKCCNSPIEQYASNGKGSGYFQFCSNSCKWEYKRSDNAEFVNHTASRFHGYVKNNGDDWCWGWSGTKNKSKYGIFVVRKKKHLAHRWAYQYFIGQIPDGLWILHRCDNPECTNPKHLYAGTPLDNTRDAIARGRFKFPPSNKGELHHSARLKSKEILQIRESPSSYSELSKIYGVRECTIIAIKKRKIWKHIP